MNECVCGSFFIHKHSKSAFKPLNWLKWFNTKPEINALNPLRANAPSKIYGTVQLFSGLLFENDNSQSRLRKGSWKSTSHLKITRYHSKHKWICATVTHSQTVAFIIIKLSAGFWFFFLNSFWHTKHFQKIKACLKGLISPTKKH